MSTKELGQVIGERGYVASDGLEIAVTIVDVKRAYGNLRYQVEPVSGRGVVWVSADRVTVGE
jgi:hypothetical protein